jgi:hypothetical protein
MPPNPNINLNVVLRSVHSEAGAPLLNEHKRTFVARRLLQTLLGGVRWRGGQPFSVTLLQLALLLLPLLCGGVFTLAGELGDLSRPLVGVLSGICAAVVHLAIQLAVFRVERKNAVSPGLLGRQKGAAISLGEEDEVDFDFGLFSHETLSYVFFGKRPLPLRAACSLLYGATCGLVTVFLLPSTIGDSYPWTGVPALFVFGWLAAMVGLYELMVGAAPEPSVYASVESPLLSALYRPFYLVFIALIHEGTRGLSEYTNINTAYYIIFCVLPLLWLLAIAPPLDALASWAGEHFIVYALGGTPAASDRRLASMLVASMALFGVKIALYLHASVTATVVVSSILGFVLSLDLSRQLFALQQWFARHSNKVGGEPLGGDGKSASSSSASAAAAASSGSSRDPYTWIIFPASNFLVYLPVLVGLPVMAGLLSEYVRDKQTGPSTAVQTAFQVLLWVLYGLMLLARELQHVYVCFGLLRNPLYPSVSSPTFARDKARLRATLGRLHQTLVRVCV